eukprot:Sdes_comp18286_c0_seq1m7962
MLVKHLLPTTKLALIAMNQVEGIAKIVETCSVDFGKLVRLLYLNLGVFPPSSISSPVLEEQEKSISLDEQKKTLAQVNYLAQQSYRSDILRGHRAQQSTNQPRLVSNHDANSGAYWAAAAASASAAAKAQAAAVDTVENNQASLHDEPETVDTPNLHLDAVYSSQPYGEWVPVETEPSATKVFDAESTSSRVESTSLFTAA